MRSLRSSALVVGSSLALASGAFAQNAVQWRVEDGGNGHWYAATAWGQVASVTEGMARALEAGAHLATLGSASEEAFVLSLVRSGSCTFPANSEVLIGLVQSAGANEPADGWTWVTGEVLDYINWRANEPNNAGGVEHQGFLNVTGGWNDGGTGALGCSHTAILEWSADCNNDGIVDYGQIRAGELGDANGNNIPDCCEAPPLCTPCRADVDGSGAVNGVDLAAILNTWGTDGGKYPGADIDGDGTVNGADLAEVLGAWGECL